MVYRSVFVQTFVKLLLPVLAAAAVLDWSQTHALQSLTVVGWSVFGALIGAAIAWLWSVAGSPATTVAGRALRAAVQALLATPLAAVVVDVKSGAQLADLQPLIVPTLAAVVIAIVVSVATNLSQMPTAVPVAETSKSLGSDFLGKAA